MSQRGGHINSECLREAIKRAINEEEEEEEAALHYHQYEEGVKAKSLYSSSWSETAPSTPCSGVNL